jgi:uncharacterized protein YdcH (DUF465 family)
VPTENRIDALRAEHDALEKRLAELDGHVSLTPAEHAERARIKKWKLKLKDEIATLAPS